MGNSECEEHEGGQGGGQERQEEVQGWEHRGNKVALLGYNFLFINDIDNHFFKEFWVWIIALELQFAVFTNLFCLVS